MSNFTQEDLVQYLYQEASSEMALAIEKAMESSWELKEKFEALKVSAELIQEVPLQSPRPQAIQAILNYAKLTAEVEQ